VKRLWEIFEEPNGGLSAYRVAYVLFMALFSLAYFINCLRAGQMVAIPMEMVAALFTMEAGKVAQRKVESIKENNEPENQSPN
jgi:hypothetical protein